MSEINHQSVETLYNSNFTVCQIFCAHGKSVRLVPLRVINLVNFFSLLAFTKCTTNRLDEQKTTTRCVLRATDRGTRGKKLSRAHVAVSHRNFLISPTTPRQSECKQKAEKHEALRCCGACFGCESKSVSGWIGGGSVHHHTSSTHQEFSSSRSVD